MAVADAASGEYPLFFLDSCAVLLRCLLLLTLLVAPVGAQHFQEAKTPRRIPLPMSTTWYLKKLPTAWLQTLPKPVKVSRVVHKGTPAYAVTWKGAQLWDALPPDQKEKIKNVGQMDRYYMRSLALAMRKG